MQDTVVQELALYVQEYLKNAEGGHDWFHIERVWKMARKLQKTEGGDLFIIDLAALLHDIADPKFHNGDESLARGIIQKKLSEYALDQIVIDQVLSIVENMSFKNHQNALVDVSIEFQIVQDADRLDAIGAVGIARTFNFGGFKGNPMYDPAIKPMKEFDKEQYKQSKSTTVNHFYEKLLLLKDKMNTDTAKKIATQRHDFMLQFLDQFYNEWEAGV